MIKKFQQKRKDNQRYSIHVIRNVYPKLGSFKQPNHIKNHIKSHINQSTFSEILCFQPRYKLQIGFHLVKMLVSGNVILRNNRNLKDKKIKTIYIQTF